MSGVAIVFTICTIAVLAASSRQNGSGQLLNPRIGPAIPQQYRAILDAKDWKNPYLVIRADGIEVSTGNRRSRKIVAPTDLRRTLTGLPLSAWPYGRVVAVQENSVRTGGGIDERPIADNLAATVAILQALRVTVARWPTA